MHIVPDTKFFLYPTPHDDKFSAMLSFCEDLDPENPRTINWFFGEQYKGDIPQNKDDARSYQGTYYGMYNRIKGFVKKQENSLAIDIGGFTGDTTLPIARLCGKTLVFEPHPVNYRQLKRNIEANPSFDIGAFECAVADQYGTIKLGYQIDPLGATNGGGIMFPHYTSKIQAKCINLEHFLSVNYPGKKVSFIKLDTEGLDVMILDNIKGLIKKDRPVIMAEIFPFYQELLSVLQDIEYEIYSFETGLKVEPKDIKIEDLILVPKNP